MRRSKPINLILFLMSVLFLSFSASLIAQESFEGKVKFKISGDGDSQVMNYFVKGEKIRMEIPGEQSAIILFDNKSMKMIMPDQKMYMEMPRKVMESMGKQEMKSNSEDMGKPIITGKTKNILGYECAQWLFDEEDGGVEMWVAKGLGNFMPMQGPMGGSPPAWQKEIMNSGFFPMLVISKDSDGKEESRFEVTEIDKKTLESSLFNVPSGYSKMSMPGMKR